MMPEGLYTPSATRHEPLTRLSDVYLLMVPLSTLCGTGHTVKPMLGTYRHINSGLHSVVVGLWAEVMTKTPHSVQCYRTLRSH